MVVPNLATIYNGRKADQDYKYEQPNCTFPSLCRNRLWHRADGTPDLVNHCSITKKQTAQGDFKAATILKRAHVAGTLDGSVTLESLGLPTDGSYDMKRLHSQPAKRQPVTVKQLGKQPKKPGIGLVLHECLQYIYDYEGLNWYDYLLGQGLCLYLQRWTWYQGIRRICFLWDPISNAFDRMG